MMSDRHGADELAGYLRASERLRQLLANNEGAHLEALALINRLQENIEAERKFGSNADIRHDRNKIVHGLDRLSLAHVGLAVADLKAPQLPVVPNHGPPRGDTRQHHYRLERLRDQQQVVALRPGYYRGTPATDAHGFVIDETLVTNSQLAGFLNHPEVARLARFNPATGLLHERGALGRVLAADALIRSRVAGAFAGLAAEPWGLRVRADGAALIWEPLPGSEDLPATMVTQLGASWYAGWAIRKRAERLPAIQAGLGLPSADQWRVAALYEQRGTWRRYPWGDEWRRDAANTLSLWARRDLPNRRMVHDVLRATPGIRPTPVRQFAAYASPCGMLDAYGNAHEWLSGRTVGGRPLIVMGACTSSIDLLGCVESTDDQPNPLIGFRCCLPLPE